MNHYLSNIDLRSEIPHGFNEITFGAGCFWGVERKFYELEGVYLTSVGYCGGSLDNPTYEQVCYEDTGHAEVVRLTFDEKLISFKKILDLFFKMHDPTQKDMQYPDVGTQYRSEIFYEDDIQKAEAKESLEIFNKEVNGKIQTNMSRLKKYCKAEEYHQKYLEKNR